MMTSRIQLVIQYNGDQSRDYDAEARAGYLQNGGSQRKLDFQASEACHETWKLLHLNTLKNLIATSFHDPERAGMIYYVSRNSILSFGPTCQPMHANERPCFTFGPRCLAVEYGWIVSGGPYCGKIATVSLNAIPHARGFGIRPAMQTREFDLGGSITNGINLFKSHQDSAVRAFICNNNHTVRVFNLELDRKEREFIFPVPMNHCFMSPNQRAIVSVGDSNEIFLNNISRDLSLESQSIIKPTMIPDSAFHTTFSANGNLFAVAHQNVLLSVWDIRNLKSAIFIKNTSNTVNPSGCRACNFSPAKSGVLDLLLYSEGCDRAHLLDTRNFENSQELPVPKDHEISGSCWSSDGTSCIVGTDNTLYSWKVDVQSRRSFPSYQLR